MRFNPLDHPLMFMDASYLHDSSAWMEHIPFAFLLIDLIRPKLVVELGTQAGVSYCSLCQAVAHLKLETKCFAVDTWKGDEQAGHYSENTLNYLRKYHDPKYGSFSELIQSTFDDTLGRFADGSIDLLHIDGLHTLEAVSHDYETWKPKVSKSGVVIFHDTTNMGPGFGVHELWAQISKEYPSFEFKHGFGLGVLAVGSEVSPKVLEFIEEANRDPETVRRMFSDLGGRCLLVCAYHFMVQQQRIVNDWKRRVGIVADPNVENFAIAIGNPINYSRYSTMEIARLAKDDLELRQRSNPPHSAPQG